MVTAAAEQDHPARGPVWNAIAALSRADGDTAGVIWLHDVPSHSHVSSTLSPDPESEPPNITNRPRSESNAIAGSNRAGGHWLGCRVQS
jgi:hypothetical protein